MSSSPQKRSQDQGAHQPSARVTPVGNEEGAVQPGHGSGSLADAVRAIYGRKRFESNTDELMKLLRG